MSIISEWFYSKAVTVGEGECLPEFKVWCLIRRLSDPRSPGGEFRGYSFFLKLPSYAWEMDECNGRLCWHQRRLVHHYDFGWRLYLYPDPRPLL